MISSRTFWISVVPFAALVLLFALSANAQQIASLEHDPIHGSNNSLVHVAGGVCVLAYEGDGNDGFIKTFDLSAIFLDGFESGDTSGW